MKISQQKFRNESWTHINKDDEFNNTKCQLVLAFGLRELIAKADIYNKLKSDYPQANIILSSTAGEIMANEVLDNSIVVSALQFEKNAVKCIKTNIGEHENSFEAGAFLFRALPKQELQSVLVFSDGMVINGSDLVEGLNNENHNNIAITGGLAGDGANFQSTVTGLNEVPKAGEIIAIGFYGTTLKIGHGSIGGWNEFGNEKIITKSDKNVLYEIDGKNALDLYKEYLGEYSKELPGSALLFPMSLKLKDSEKTLVRTILSINNNEKTMTFAGNIPEGSKVRLMKANFDKLIDGSAEAAKNTFNTTEDAQPEFALLISCVGRKLVLQDRTEEEVEASNSIFGDNTHVTGFYSYGEICPFTRFSKCELHNQTMTITTFSEN
ncbi:MAG: FIST N-terminal domain-containing protein [Bacteroidota bacterium]